MAVTLSNEAHAAATDAVLGLIGSFGFLKLRLSGSLGTPGAVAATLSFAEQAFLPADSTGVAAADTITSDSSAVGNASAVATATMESSGGSIIVHFGVAASGSDADLSNGLTIAAGDVVSCSSLTFKAIGP